MFKSLKAVTYCVPDLEQAKRWYAQVLNAQPVLDTPQVVYFLIGENPLALVPNTLRRVIRRLSRTGG